MLKKTGPQLEDIMYPIASRQRERQRGREREWDREWGEGELLLL